MQSSSVFLAAKPLSSPSFRVKALLTNPSTKTASDSGSMAASAPKWAQKSITLPPQWRGCHLITPKVRSLRYEDFQKAMAVIRPSLQKSKWEDLEQWNREFGSNLTKPAFNLKDPFLVLIYS